MSAVEQEAPGGAAIALKERQGAAHLTQPGEWPALVDPTTAAQENDALELIPQEARGMQHNAATEGMAKQHHRPPSSTLFSFLRQPAAIGRQSGAEALGALGGTKSRQIRCPAGPLRLKLLLQGLPNAPAQQPPMGHHQLGVRFS